MVRQVFSFVSLLQLTYAHVTIQKPDLGQLKPSWTEMCISVSARVLCVGQHRKNIMHFANINLSRFIKNKQG